MAKGLLDKKLIVYVAASFIAAMSRLLAKRGGSFGSSHIMNELNVLRHNRDYGDHIIVQTTQTSFVYYQLMPKNFEHLFLPF